MIRVEFLPPLATVQDLGRDGFWAQGLGRAGAMDPMGHRLANLLLGNAPDAATLEIPMGPAEFVAASDGRIALAGGLCDAALDGVALPRAMAVSVRAGQRLTLGPIRQGGPVYLALAGGIDVPKVLGSRATQIREAFGGFGGRVLAAGDLLEAAGTAPALPMVSQPMPAPERDAQGAILVRALPSSELGEFSAAAVAAFWSSPYRVSAQSNRQGFRLEGAALERPVRRELRSHGIVPGIVQVPNGGQPIIQLADCATMGGYPKIAAVIEADLWAVAQARAGESLRFVETDLAGAKAAAEAHMQQFETLARQISSLLTLTQSWG